MRPTRSMQPYAPGDSQMRLLASVLLLTCAALGTNHYVLPSPGGASGTTGVDWAHACNEFTGNCAAGSLVRGDTYYFGGGTYAATIRQFNTAISGTTTITIRGCLTTNLACTSATGWSSSMGVDVAQAVFPPGSCSSSYPGCVSIRFGDYIVFDCAVGDGLSSTYSSYGCYISPPTTGLGYQQHPVIFDGGNDTFEHWAAQTGGTADDTEQELIYYGSSGVANNYLAYFWCGPAQTQINIWSGSSNWLIEHGRIAPNFSTSSHHGVNVNSFGATGVTVRYNIFDECLVTGCFEANNATAAINGWAIYGNLILNSQGQGTISADGVSTVINTVAYNNTVVNQTGNFFFNNNGTGNVSENNIFYNSNCSLQNSGTGLTYDYNSYLSCTRGSAPTETHGQVVTLKPFVNSGGGNYKLAAYAVASCASTSATCTGRALSSPYNVDPNGVTRGVDGTWERGAYADPGGPSPPVGLKAAVQ